MESRKWFPLELTLKEARKKRDILRLQIQESIDPAKSRKEQKAQEQSKLEYTFEAIALKWAEKHYQNKSPKTRATDMSRLARDVFPEIGSAQIAEVTTQDMLKLIEKIEGRKAFEAARRTRALCARIFNYAIALELADKNPADNARVFPLP